MRNACVYRSSGYILHHQSPAHKEVNRKRENPPSATAIAHITSWQRVHLLFRVGVVVAVGVCERRAFFFRWGVYGSVKNYELQCNTHKRIYMYKKLITGERRCRKQQDSCVDVYIFLCWSSWIGSAIAIKSHDRRQDIFITMQRRLIKTKI